jgi:hypothetical protein
MSVADEALLSKAVYDFVSSLTDTSCHYESMPSDAKRLPCVSVQTLTGDPVEKRYKSGGYIGNYRFAVYHRQKDVDNASRLDAAKILSDLAQKINEGGKNIVLPTSFDFWGLTQDTLPVKVTVDVAFDDWQATFTLRYKKG